MRPFVPFILSLLLVGLLIKNTAAKDYRGVIVRIGELADTVEKNVARLLVDRLNESGVVKARIERESEPGEVASNELLVLLGIPEHHDAIASLFNVNSIPELTQLSPGPEGFLLKMVSDEKNHVLLAAASLVASYDGG
ncbi:unnamed protein product [marine sediment metagenome]|uniref:Uncharacterized protein n=1 Tax=marine sediment metagenome TaxID=412755 RepID=X1VBH9_9ZZZZ